MEVKIDADELCELRKKASEQICLASPSELIHYNGLIKSIARLEEELSALRESNSTIVASFRELGLDYNKLVDERDWWRSAAFYRGDNLRAIKNITDELDYGQLVVDAEALGYDAGPDVW